MKHELSLYFVSHEFVFKLWYYFSSFCIENQILIRGEMIHVLYYPMTIYK